MKKLMIAACAVAIASVVNAAAVSWEATVMESNADWNSPVGSVVFATGDQSWTAAFAESLAVVNITGDTTGIFATGTDWTATITADLLNVDGDGNYTPGGTFTKTYAFTMPALTGDPTLDAGTLGGLNDAISLALMDANLGTLPLASDAAAQGWAAVPEPTSGLLLLLGVAGLALKRKRA